MKKKMQWEYGGGADLIWGPQKVAWGRDLWAELQGREGVNTAGGGCVLGRRPSRWKPRPWALGELRWSDMHFPVLLLEKAMAPHSSTLAWKIPWMEEPGRLQSMGSRRVGHDWATSFSLFTFMHWRRKWQPTPVFLPGESQGRGSLVGCHLWGRTESDMTEVI